MNILNSDNNTYYLISYWRKHKNDNKTLDSNKNKFPMPTVGKFWSDKEQFIDKLELVEKYAILENKFFKFEHLDEKCLLCDYDKFTIGYFKLGKFIWKDNLIHYIKKHNVKPDELFVEFIYNYEIDKNIQKINNVKIGSKVYKIDNRKYVKIHRNQILIMDALMIHGGYKRKYYDSIKEMNKIPDYKYSEHSGLLDIDDGGLDKIIVSATTSRLEENDNEIFLPRNMKEAYEYEYIFHTHPPTPKPGGRVSVGILYDFPSINDMLHFMHHHNYGNTQGSIVVASEGLYNIRKFDFNRDKIVILDNGKKEAAFIETINAVSNNIHKKSLAKYGTKFTTAHFYNKISQDFTFIDEYNNKLHDFDLHIDFFPRIRDKYGNWVIDTIYLPVYITDIV